MAATTMALVNGTLIDGLHSKVYEEGDVAIDDWALVSSPLPVLITILYLGVVRQGIRWMEDKPAYQLTTALRVYNLFQICFNLYLLTSVFRLPAEANDILWQCCSEDLSGAKYEGTKPTFLLYFWGYFISKITDLSDTIFFVLRKKNSQISFLHIYHHAGMVVFTWISLRYTKAHQAAFPGFLNVIVHVIMYTYYFLATFGPEVQKYLWWKRYLTKLQMLQFTVVLVYFGSLYYNDCPVPTVFSYIWVFNTSLVFILFINFYIQTYIVKKTNNYSMTTKNK